MSAVSARPVPLAVPPMRAWFVMLARVIAMAAPMPAEPLVVALPSALDAASAASRACRVSMPPLVTLTKTGIDAVDDAFASVIAIAAATLIGLPPVEASQIDPESSMSEHEAVSVRHLKALRSMLIIKTSPYPLPTS